MYGKQPPTFIAPEYLYPLRGFYAASGVTPARRSEARKQGIELPTIEVGRRKFVRGADGIAFIERLAAVGQQEAMSDDQ